MKKARLLFALVLMLCTLFMVKTSIPAITAQSDSHLPGPNFQVAGFLGGPPFVGPPQQVVADAPAGRD